MSEGSLSSAAEKNDIDEVERLLKLEMNPNVPDNFNLTPLIHAIRNNNLNMAKILLSHGADPNFQRPNRTRPLSYCGRRPGKINIPMVKLLFEYDADPNFEDSEGPPIVWAAQDGDLELVEIFLANGANPNYQETQTGYTALSYAVNQNNLKMAKVLIEYGADPNLEDIDGKSSFAYAVIFNSSELIELFLESGVDAYRFFDLLDNVLVSAKTEQKNRLIEMAKKLRKAEALEIYSKVYDISQLRGGIEVYRNIIENLFPRWDLIFTSVQLDRIIKLAMTRKKDYQGEVDNEVSFIRDSSGDFRLDQEGRRIVDTDRIKNFLRRIKK